MKNFKYLFTGLFAVLFLAGCHHTGGSEGAESESAGEIMTEEKEMMEEGEMTEEMEGEKMMEKEEMMEGVENKEMEGEAAEEMGYYVPYSAEKMTALAGQKKAVFFHAEWCGTCRKWEKMIGEAGDALPAGSVILKADFDADKELVAQYEVASQSTLVFLDENGAVVEKLLDPPVEKLAELFSTSA